MSLCFAFASIAYFASLLTFSPTSGPACAFFIAWGGMASQVAPLVGLLVLSCELRSLGVARSESLVFWILLGIGLVMVFATNAISIGTTKVVQQLGVSLCYRKHFLPTSLVASLIYLALSTYSIFRLRSFISPPFLQLEHQVLGLKDNRILRALALMLLELLTIVPSATFISIPGEFIPFSIGSIAVLAAFNYRVPAPVELHITSIPPTISATPSDGRSLVSRMQSARSVARSVVTANQPFIPNHPYSSSSLSDNSIHVATDGFLGPPQTARSSRSFDSTTAKSIEQAIVQVAGKYPRATSRTISGVLGPPPSGPRQRPINAEGTSASFQPEHGSRPSRQILADQAQFAERFQSEGPSTADDSSTPRSGLMPRRPAIAIVTTPPAEPANRRSSVPGMKSARSSVVYGSDIIRHSYKQDAMKRYSTPAGIISPTTNASPTSHSPRDSLLTATSGGSQRHLSWAVAKPRGDSDDLSTVYEGSPQRETFKGVSRSASKRTFGGTSMRSVGYGDASRHGLPSNPRLRPAFIFPMPPAGVPSPSSDPVSPRMPLSARTPEERSSRVGGLGVIRGPRPPPRTYGSAERAFLTPLAAYDGEMERQQRRRSASTSDMA
ncbi:hypothetical protein PLICRDRAFT_48118 [Plicaturopsis crispa FD-325 SS-3]|nr:hypothetical protein PLICRDRAFT_48118 [Plicaturopsis crispa FD-325 SS-3]